jgi:hypothetical protein
MSDMEVVPDPIVRTALQRLPIPAHEEGFWARLNALLDAEGASIELGVVAGTTDDRPQEPVAPAPAAATATSPSPEPDLDPALALVPKALRRTSNGVLLAVAAAAAVVVALASTTLLDERDGTTSASDEEAQTFQASTLVDDAPLDGASPAALSTESEAASSDAVLEWVDDVGAGDTSGAWEAMGPVSQAHFGSQDAFEAEMSSLAEGYGAWSASEPDEVLVTPVLATDEGTTAVVTLVGTVELEGTRERRADAFPVRLVDGEAVIEPFASAGALEIVVPEPSPEGMPLSVDAGDELVVVVPSDADAPVLRLDHGEALVCGEAEGTELTDLEGSPGQRCSYLPPEGIAEGEHTLTMAFVGPDGASITAESMLLDAA